LSGQGTTLVEVKKPRIIDGYRKLTRSHVQHYIELVANNIVTSNSSVVLVLDRSGSMLDVANSGFTKHQLLKSAVGVVHSLI